MSLAVLAIILFASIFLLILYGYPVAFTLGGLSLLYATCFLELSDLSLLPNRVWGIMTNYLLLAVPLFIFMGIMLEKSGLAEKMLQTMTALFGKLRGGMAISVIIVGALLAASTGIVGATVVTMGLISLPPMLKGGYKAELATGTIAASGTLGQIIPPSVVLVLLGSVLGVSVGDLFREALIPGVVLVASYVLYVVLYGVLRPTAVPRLSDQLIREFQDGEKGDSRSFTRRLLESLFLPLLLILAVLGSIFMGYASPTEAAAIGALGATLLTIMQGKFSWSNLKAVSEETTHLTSMVFMILLGATTFSLVFRQLGGDRFLVDLILAAELSPAVFILLVMLIVFIAGFFIDFIEIIFIIVPVVAPIFVAMGVDLVWIGILLALNLQTSFLTPPFGFSLFYLKGVAPPEVKTSHLYRGIIPFLLIQLVVLIGVFLLG